MNLLHKLGKIFLLLVVFTAGLLMANPNLVKAQELMPEEAAFASALILDNEESSVNTSQTDVANNENAIVKNSATIKNNISIYANTGRNSSKENVGSVNIQTGDSRIEVEINNIVNTTAVVPGCCLVSPTPRPDPGDPGLSHPNNLVTATPSPVSSYLLPAGAEASAGGPSVLGLSDTSSMFQKVKDNFWLIVGINLITIGAIFFFESFGSAKKDLRQ